VLARAAESAFGLPAIAVPTETAIKRNSVQIANRFIAYTMYDAKRTIVTPSGAMSADEATAELAHDRVLLHARRSDGDLAARRAVTAWVHRREEAPHRRQIRKVANGATEGGTPRLVLAPDVVHGLARNRDPTARFA
jgi:hypothetical protein